MNKGEQKINLSGDETKEFKITVQVIVQNPLFNPIVIVIIGGLLLGLAFFYLKSKTPGK